MIDGKLRARVPSLASLTASHLIGNLDNGMVYRRYARGGCNVGCAFGFLVESTEVVDVPVKEVRCFVFD